MSTRNGLLIVMIVLCCAGLAIASDLINPVTDHGVYGRYDSDLVSGEFPAGSEKYHLWEGRLWIGTQADAVSYVTAAGPGNYEWTPDGGGSGQAVEIGGDLLEWTAEFNDLAGGGGHTPIGLNVVQTVTAFDQDGDPLGAHHIKVVVENTTGALIDSLYVGWVFDFDICFGPEGDSDAASQDDRVGWDPTRGMAYMYDGDNPGEPGDDTGDNGISPGYAGLVWLDDESSPAAYQSWASGNDPATDSAKYSVLSGEGDPFPPVPTDPDDYRVMLSAGPLTIAPGQQQTIAIGFAAGDGLDGLETSADEIIAWHNRPVQFEMIPEQTIVPPQGGQISYGVRFTSELNLTVPGVTYWTNILFPNGQLFEGLQVVPFTLVPFMDVFVTGLTQNVPELAPEGEFVYSGHVGFFPNAQLSDEFVIEKLGSGPAGTAVHPHTWPSNVEARLASAQDADMGTAIARPDGFRLHPAHPNPFNGQTSLSMTLPEAGEVQVDLVNIQGQTVRTLQSGTLQAGTHRIALHANDLASGVYLVRAEASGFTTLVQKVVLVR